MILFVLLWISNITVEKSCQTGTQKRKWVVSATAPCPFPAFPQGVSQPKCTKPRGRLDLEFPRNAWIHEEWAKKPKGCNVPKGYSLSQ